MSETIRLATEAYVDSEIDKIKNGTNTEEEEIKVEEITYTYDGNDTSSDYTWILNTGRDQAFVKVGDIPEGEIDLVGGYVSVKVPSDSWFDYNFTITEEMTKEMVTVGGVDIYADKLGLQQIFYKGATDASPISVILICTKPGSYDIAFNGWMEFLTIEEKGIYVFDNRSYGGNKYVESFSCKIITNNSQSEDINPTEYDGKEIQVFSRGICIGDSITEGVFNHSEGEVVFKKYSYPSILKRITGIEIVNAGIAGLTSKSWYETSLNSDLLYGKWVNNEWVWNTNPEVKENDVVSSSLDYSNFDFAIIHLGINDVGLMGSVPVSEMLTSFETNINNIVAKLKDSNNGIKIFLATIIPCYTNIGNSTFEALNEKIREIANATSDVYLIDLNAYSELFDKTPYENQHLTAIGYHKMASEIASLISYNINKNLNDFKYVQFIGTSYNG